MLPVTDARRSVARVSSKNYSAKFSEIIGEKIPGKSEFRGELTFRELPRKN